MSSGTGRNEINRDVGQETMIQRVVDVIDRGTSVNLSWK